MRHNLCPICGTESPSILQLHFNQKMKLPTEVTIRHCASDNFLFVSNCDQDGYDEFYKSVANDSYHAELAGGHLHSPIAKRQRDQLVRLLGDFFSQPRRVLDFGCGEAWLLMELAKEFPHSNFSGFDPSPGAQIGARKAAESGLTNLFISDEKPRGGPYDLIIASHVLEHLIDFDLLGLWSNFLSDTGFLYIEVPDASHYAAHGRLEFLYYFDRLHVNHFTPEALGRLVAAKGFGYTGHAEYTFPYWDRKEYPALGMLFGKGRSAVDISSPSIMETATLYISQERQRAKALNEQLRSFDGVLVWGAGDNFHRSSENGGPLSDLTNMIVLDRRPQVITIGPRKWTTENPLGTIPSYPWPVVVTITEGRETITQQVKEIDPFRQVLFV